MSWQRTSRVEPESSIVNAFGRHEAPDVPLYLNVFRITSST
jgi:hypothetical protein